jgi:hypothetical protein
MANLAIILPCAVLGSICAAMLAFIWWWFPRTWNKGNKQEEGELDAAIGAGAQGNDVSKEERLRIAGQRAREYLEAVEARNKARAEGRDTGEPLPRYE